MAEDVKTRIMPAEVVIHPFGDIDEALLNAVQQAIELRFHIRAIRGEYRNLPDNLAIYLAWSTASELIV